MTTDLQPKCSIVDRGFQEKYDQIFRRDSQAGTPLTFHIMCSIAASERMLLYASDARGAFQGKNLERELYIKLPSNLGPCHRPHGLSAGCLLRLNKSIYGTNDAVRAWYLASLDTLIGLGWHKFSFEVASFIWRRADGHVLVSLGSMSMMC